MKREHMSDLPDTPGVYFFLSPEKEILYIGKATSLRDRVRSYYSTDIHVTRGPKIATMLSKATSVAYQPTDSVLEALLLESERIKEHAPTYNTDLKDNKSFNFVIITDEDFPRVLTIRGRELAEGKAPGKILHLFGPFPNGLQLRAALKIIRHIFPFRDVCRPANEKQGMVRTADSAGWRTAGGTTAILGQGKPCFNRQIGLCPGVCTGEITHREYAAIIRNIVQFFEGKKGMILRRLEREMRAWAKKLEFEKANEVKKTLFALQHIEDVALIKEQGTMNNEQGTKTIRIEAYDVAHLAGGSAVGVMTVVENSIVEKNAYRKFRLRKEYQGNDLSALEEILRRRLSHPEWPLPDILAVDGALLQYGVAERILAEQKLIIPIVGIVKNDRHKPDHIIGDAGIIQRYTKEILLANAEAHRFAITYHRKRRNKDFLPEK
ncbi:MAG: GIY-YIG nuclease family protein [Candidatus Moraniibacteriota bacterium]